MVSTAKRGGFHVTLLTNGTFLDETGIKSLIDSRLDILKVSLWASSSDEYKRNYPGAVQDNFDKIVNELHRLAHLKAEQKSNLPSVTLHYPINRNNFCGIDRMVELTYKTRCNTLSFSPLATRRGELASFVLSPDEEKLLIINLTMMKRQLNSLSINHNIDLTLMRYRIGEAVWKKLPCYIAWVQSQIKVDGTVLPCDPCDLIMGNIKENRFRDIWNGSAYKNFRRQTLTREDLTEMSIYCDCSFCCHIVDNVRVNRIFRWFSPFLIGQKKKMDVI